MHGLYHPDAGSDAAEKLALIASMTTPHPRSETPVTLPER